ncbi:hypothetical protein JCM4814A_03350 [Streptomyces phaeofaciens JCM 4814]|uniref:Uncharacterized protein n=1 Tax=Streptomyces phaeofaciens TaxID=68254 RepID=A0A918HR60_9ACTN|nr:hypothetical protein [Streptomyces phaeofaciens]GGT97667.1 hypothetical protein GCM10010226_88950 [Streptomyces phaeofaciens]
MQGRGRLFLIVDRKKDLIIRGRYNVYPREIKEVLYEHPEILEEAVVRVAHNFLGEETPRPSYWCPTPGPPQPNSAPSSRSVSPGAYPRDVHVLPSLPKAFTGQILRRESGFPAVEGERHPAARSHDRHRSWFAGGRSTAPEGSLQLVQ